MPRSSAKSISRIAVTVREDSNGASISRNVSVPEPAIDRLLAPDHRSAGLERVDDGAQIRTGDAWRSVRFRYPTLSERETIGKYGDTFIDQARQQGRLRRGGGTEDAILDDHHRATG